MRLGNQDLKGDGRLRVVAVCVQAGTAQTPRNNTSRIKLLRAVIRNLEKVSWPRLDCLLFPGGFFHLPQYVGHLSFQVRAKTILESNFGTECQELCLALDRIHPGAVVVAGVDSVERTRSGIEGSDGMDQLCVAWNGEGVKAIGRKVFPIGNRNPQDDCIDESYSHVCYVSDFSTENRLVKFSSGHTAVLCSCYDMFGCAETGYRRTIRTEFIRFIDEDGALWYQDDHGFDDLRQRCIHDWTDLLSRNRVSVGLGAIHRFARPGLDTFWQRHGIATCSAAFGGGLAVGAAHFEQGLPKPDKSTLAAASVAQEHLRSGRKRAACSMRPKHHIEAPGRWIARLFEV